MSGLIDCSGSSFSLCTLKCNFFNLGKPALLSLASLALFMYWYHHYGRNVF